MRRQLDVVRALLAGSSLLIAACTTATRDSDGALISAAARPAGSSTARSMPGGVVRQGSAYASMAAQYQPRAGNYTATGASAWVPAAPPAAFVLSGPLPEAAPPPPPLAAVANRQPDAPAAAPASEIARPEAAQPQAPQPSAAAAPNPGVRTAGLALFNDYSCGACHALADANASGSIGPSLDRNPRLTKAYAVDIINNGRGAMPSFAGQMSPEQIDQIAEYIVQFSRK